MVKSEISFEKVSIYSLSDNKCILFVNKITNIYYRLLSVWKLLSLSHIDEFNTDCVPIETQYMYRYNLPGFEPFQHWIPFLLL